MNDFRSREDLQFFGRICASVSHDLKNVLAVVNEGAGLLSDLSLMAEKGMPLDPAKLRSVAGSIQAQIRRGDEIIKGLNTFAHSVDEPVSSVNLAEVVSLVVSLAARLARARNVSLEVGACDEVFVRIDVYALEYLLHGMVTHALAHAEDGGVLTFSCSSPGGGSMATLTGAGLGTGAELPGELTALAGEQDVVLAADAGTKTLELVIGKEMK